MNLPHNDRSEARIIVDYIIGVQIGNRIAVSSLFSFVNQLAEKAVDFAEVKKLVADLSIREGELGALGSNQKAADMVSQIRRAKNTLLALVHSLEMTQKVEDVGTLRIPGGYSSAHSEAKPAHVARFTEVAMATIT